MHDRIIMVSGEPVREETGLSVSATATTFAGHRMLQSPAEEDSQVRLQPESISEPKELPEGGEEPSPTVEEVDEENNYNKELCNNHCVIRDLVGCEGCGIFQYAYKRNEIKVKITRI